MTSKRWLPQILNISVPLLVILLSIFQPPVLAGFIVIPRECWLLLGIFLLCLTFQLRPRTSWKIALALWLTFAILLMDGPTGVLRSFTSDSAKKDSQNSLKIITLNCGENLSQLLADLRPLSPDAVLLQESPGQETVERWAQELFGDEGDLVWGRDCSLIARGELRQIDTDLLARYTQAIWKSPIGKEIHLMSVRLNPPTVRVDFWNPQCWQAHQTVLETQFSQTQKLIADLDSNHGHQGVIIGGDFNCPADSPCDRLIRKQNLSDAFRRAGQGWGNTITNDYPFHRIDRIYASPGFTIDSAQARKTHSDHRLVECVLTWTGE